MSRRLTAITAAVAIALLAACGGDNDDAADPTDPPPATTAPTAGEPSAPVTPGTGAPPTAATAPSGTADPATTAATAPVTAAPTAAEPVGDPAATLTEVAVLEAPVDLAWRDGDAGRYVVEQDGRVTRLGEGDEATVVADLTDRTEADGEQGLLGLAFAPAGDVAYVNYVDDGGDTVIAEYPVDGDGRFDVDAERVVLQIDQPYANHNGGDLTFGPDGLLYIGMGDGGAGGDPERRATDPSTLLGKLLRIDPAASGDDAYTVPADNPFVGVDGTAPEIWASGLRNPWRFSFDRATGDLWIADVGQGDQEEVDAVPATDGVGAGRGLSFGWSAFEGDQRFNDDVSGDGHTPPVHVYDHAGGGCSVSGGVRARNAANPTLEGRYVYGDFCLGTVWALAVTGEGADLATGDEVELGSVANLTAVVDGPDGELYALSQQGGVYRLDEPS